MTAGMTTAELRREAQAAEKRGEMREAARLWERAIEVYPVRGEVRSHLESLDMRHMRERADAALVTARENGR